MTDLAFTSATELVRLLAARDVSSRELTEVFLDRIDAHDAELNSYIERFDDEARATAAEADERAARGGDVPVLNGLPVSVKGLALVEGRPMTLGSRAWARTTAPVDDQVVTRLRGAGCVLLGMTNVPELGSTPYSESELYGPARNPWNLDHTAGGSSGGAASSVAAGLCAAAHGSDGAGSIRIPASSCGVVGLKPSRDRISSAPLMWEMGPGFNTSGALTRTVADNALLLDVLSGHVPGDPGRIVPPSRPFAEEPGSDPGRLRVGVLPQGPISEYAPEVRAALERTVRRLEDLGHDVVEVSIDVPDDVVDAMNQVFGAIVATQPLPDDGLEPLNRWVRERSRQLTATDIYGAEWRIGTWVRGFMPRFHHEFDVLAAPVLTRLPYRVGEVRGLDPADEWQANVEYVGVTPMANATGQPSLSLPLEWDDESGLPIGIQFLGRFADEATLLRLGAQLEAAHPWTDRRPPPFA